MGFLDDVVSFGENALDAGEKAVGNVVDAGTDVLADGMRAVGLDGAADAVEDFGDTLADQLGATPDEKSLDETEDPKELVHGDPGAMHDRAGKLSTMSGSLDTGGQGLRGISVGDWGGEASEGYDAKTAAEFPKWFTAADACEAAGTALNGLADAVTWSQTQAAEAVRLWKEAKRQHDAWADDKNRRTDAYNSAANSYNSGATDVKPSMPTFGPDPGPALKDEANRVLRSAREHRNSAADSAAGALKGAADKAPELAGAASRLADTLDDASTTFNIMKDHFAVGAASVVTDTVKMVRTVNPSDPYNMAHPAEYARNATALGAGLTSMAAHPEEFGKAFLGNGWDKDPAQAAGSLTANIMSLAAPGPKGAGALSSATRAGATGAREAATAASAATREAATASRTVATSGARGLESVSRDVGAGARDAASSARPPISHPSEAPRASESAGAGESRGADAGRNEGPVAAERDSAAPAAKDPDSDAVAPTPERPGGDTSAPHDQPADGSSAPHDGADSPAADRPTADTGPADKPADPVAPDKPGPDDPNLVNRPDGSDAPTAKDPEPIHNDLPPKADEPSPTPQDHDVAPPKADEPSVTPRDHDVAPVSKVEEPTAPNADPPPRLHDELPTKEPDTVPSHADDVPSRDPGSSPQHSGGEATDRTPPSPAPTRSASVDPPAPVSHAPSPAHDVRPTHDATPQRVEPSNRVEPQGRVDPVQPKPDVLGGRADPPSVPRDPGLPPRHGPGADAPAQPVKPSTVADPRGPSHTAHNKPEDPGAAAAVATRPGETVTPAGGRPAEPAPAREVGGGKSEATDSPDGQTDPHDDHYVNTSKPDGDLSDAATEPKDCTSTGEPVDVATGEYFLPATDVALPGVLPLTMVRCHRSGYRSGHWFGPSWSSTLDARVVADDDGVTTIDPDGVVLRFPPVDGDGEVHPVVGRLWRLRRTPRGGYLLTDRTGDRSLWFDPKPQLGGADTAAQAFSLSAITDRHRNRIIIGYSAMGVPVSVEHSGGYRLAIDSTGGRVIRYRAISMSDAGVTSTTLREFGYDEGDLVAVTDAEGATTRFAYDDDHRMVSWSDSIGQTYENVYDDQGRIVYQSGVDGVWAGRFDYRELGDGTGSVTAYTDAVGATTFYGMDVDGRPQRVADPMGRTTFTRWDVRRNPISSTDPAGAVTTYDYNDEGDLVRIADPTGASTTIGYAAPGRPSRVVAADGTVQTIGYDDDLNPVSVTDAAGAVRTVGYSDSGVPSESTDADGRRTVFAADAAGLPTSVIDPQGNTTSVDYDDFGRPVRLVAADGAVTQRRYDLGGRVLAEVAPDGGTQTWTYDGEGNRLSHTDAVGAVTSWEYGFYDLPVARIDNDGSRTTFEYDRARRLIGVVNPLGRRWSYEYFADGRVAREVDFAGAETTFTYDDAGRLASKTNGAGERIDYSYDAVGRLISERSGDEVVEYGYDAAGRMVSASNAFGQLALGYDAVGRTVSESWNAAAVLSRWSAGGDLTERITPAGTAAGYGYDARGVLAGMAVGDRIIDLATDAVGRETRRAFGTSAIDSQWDAAGRLTRRSVVAGLTDPGRINFGLSDPEPERLAASSGFAYRADGALLSVTGEGPAGKAVARDARFDLDPMGRVRSVTDAAGALVESFAYDAGSNIVAGGADDGGERAGWEYRDGRLMDDGRSSYGYDGAGRVVQVVRRRLSRKPDVWRYRWDAWDRLREVVDPSGRRWGYEYDPMGRRVAKVADDGSRTSFAWSGTQLVEQVDEATGDGLAWVYAPGGLTPLAQLTVSRQARPAPSSGGLLDMAGLETDVSTSTMSQSDVDQRFYAIVSDQIGMPVGLLDPDTGAFAGRATNTLWGQSAWTGESTPLRFPGQYADEESGLFYNLMRYYSPGTGRYLTPDPLGLAPAPNPYAYPTNPATACDPLGLIPVDCDGAAPDPLPDDLKKLAEQHITNNGTTVLGGFPKYIKVAIEHDASYFSVGDMWDKIIADGIDPWLLNEHFLDNRIAAGDRMIIAPKDGVTIPPTSYLRREIDYLLDHGYTWADRFLMHPPGG
ncbi:putative T7SS-secreted protein [Williamsia phyllosphaerae]|uniref:Uncharacterized protein n=1 Tax=Williamsia phyllosphaerae TaxID=885042 RepID=A0ABQ1V281_9NOCA|nr:DUF6531 domain-containing protein [Williamsia phyllosphaerae]GGF35554.1 hypothetical protein GCM10007298_34200 [Williamsia phyllosphaerae]